MSNVYYILTRGSFANKEFTIDGETLPLTAHCSVFYRLRKTHSVACKIEKRQRHNSYVFHATLIKPFTKEEQAGVEEHVIQ